MRDMNGFLTFNTYKVLEYFQTNDGNGFGFSVQKLDFQNYKLGSYISFQ